MLAALLVSCAEEKVYECGPWDERLCVCPSGEEGKQECSRGTAFADPRPPRVWKKCSCCYDYKHDDHGLNYVDKNLDAGCWDDVYNPSLPSYIDIGPDE